MRKIRSILWLLLLALCPLAALAAAPASAVEPNFLIRIGLTLCPEYRVNPNTILHVYYQKLGDANRYEAALLATNVDSTKANAVVDISFPNVDRLSVQALLMTCENQFGESQPSARYPISNCDFIRLLDSDDDGLSDDIEDTNCNEFFDAGDYSNFLSQDSDQDGIDDSAERLAESDPLSVASSPYPRIVKGQPFDPDGDATANAVVFRPSNGTWYIRDYETPGNMLSFSWGMAGDIPFTYEPAQNNGRSDVGVIRRSGNELLWIFHGPGLLREDFGRQTFLSFGSVGDIPLPGPWETAGVTVPAFARFIDRSWWFVIYRRNGLPRSLPWGTAFDYVVPQDYDGDGVLDPAVWRPSLNKYFIISSKSGEGMVINGPESVLGLPVRGDISGDGTADIIHFAPETQRFTVLSSESGFHASSRLEYSLEISSAHLALDFIRQGGQDLLSVLDPEAALRYFRPANEESATVLEIQWGLPGDAQG